MEPNRKYSVWHDRGEQWDADDIDPPAFKIRTDSFASAAWLYLDSLFESKGDVTLIVRDDASGEYRRIEVERRWHLRSEGKTSLSELCKP